MSGKRKRYCIGLESLYFQKLVLGQLLLILMPSRVSGPGAYLPRLTINPKNGDIYDLQHQPVF